MYLHSALVTPDTVPYARTNNSKPNTVVCNSIFSVKLVISLLNVVNFIYYFRFRDIFDSLVAERQEDAREHRLMELSKVRIRSANSD